MAQVREPGPGYGTSPGPGRGAAHVQGLAGNGSSPRTVPRRAEARHKSGAVIDAIPGAARRQHTLVRLPAVRIKYKKNSRPGLSDRHPAGSVFSEDRGFEDSEFGTVP